VLPRRGWPAFVIVDEVVSCEWVGERGLLRRGTRIGGATSRPLARQGDASG